MQKNYNNSEEQTYYYAFSEFYFLGEENFKNCFSILAPTKINEAIYYTLFIECDEKQKIEIIKNQEKLNELLCENYHYDYAYKLGQLKKCKIFLIIKGL